MKAGMTLFETRGYGLNPSFTSSVSTRLIDSMSPKKASVIGRGIPLRDHLRNENKLTESDHLQHYLWDPGMKCRPPVSGV